MAIMLDGGKPNALASVLIQSWHLSFQEINTLSNNIIVVFISHAWAYSDHYNTLSDWIFRERWTVGVMQLSFTDNSIPKSSPIHNASTDQELKSAIYNKIYGSHIVVAPTGMYAQYSKWIQKELDGAKMYRKPILAVDPWGQKRSASVVANAANKAVGWNKQSVVGGIWDLLKYK